MEIRVKKTPQRSTCASFIAGWGEAAPVGYILCADVDYASTASTSERVAVLKHINEVINVLAAMLITLGDAFLILSEAERAEELVCESLNRHPDDQSWAGVVDCLLGLGSLAVVHGLPDAGGRLLAVASTLRGRNNTQTRFAKLDEVAQYLHLSNTRLLETVFQAQPTAEEAQIPKNSDQYPQNLSQNSSAVPEPNEGSCELTRREREVAALIQMGLSNRAIANQLVLSPRTVERHVTNILSKLNLTSRTQIVRWAMVRDLQPGM